MPLAVAFKEWAVICQALAEGRQAIILRKGGIAEEGGTFQPEHVEFLLYPTFFHEHREGVKPEFLPLLEQAEAESRAEGTIRFTHFARVAEVKQITNLNGALTLGPLHGWTREVVRQRFHYRTSGLYVLAVRVYRLRESVTVPERPEYAGCKTWVMLDTPVDTADAEPVLSDEAFAQFTHSLAERTQGEPVSERKVALVTGSGKRRVGSHVAEALAARGYAIAVHYRSSETDALDTATRLESQFSVPAFVVQADLTDERAVKQMVAATLERFGHIDALVNCAALWKRKRLEDVTARDVREHLDTNLLGTFLTCQHIGLAMVGQATGGSIVNLGDWAYARPYTDFAAYFPSKAAIPGLTRMFAVELGTRNPNVRVNAVLPGPVMLPLDLPAAERDQAIASTLVKREGSPAHIAAAVLHFLDNDFVTGTCLPVDGGRSVFANGF